MEICPILDSQKEVTTKNRLTLKQSYSKPTLNLQQYTSESPMSIKKFTLFHKIGEGSLGKVWKVRLKNRFYAMKEVKKSKIKNKKISDSIINERNILGEIKHPLIVNLCFAFQDREKIYLVMDLMPGGDLRTQISAQFFFSELQVKFFAACIVSGLEYLHNNGIIHRDIKPENLVFSLKGYLKIADFGLARRSDQDNSKEISGTPGYMAPEVLCLQNHSTAVDYFALGVILHELIMKYRPYEGRDRNEIRDSMLCRQAKIKTDFAPSGWSADCIDFVNQLLQRRPNSRLGYHGSQEVKNHIWIRGFDWAGLNCGRIIAPFIPTEKGYNIIDIGIK